MHLNPLLELLRLSPEYASLLDGIRKGWKEQMVYGLSGSLKTFLLAGLRRETGRSCLILTANAQQAEKIREDIQTWLPGDPVYVFPPTELLPFEVAAYSPEIAAQRLTLLEALARGERPLVVAPVTALLRKLVPAGVFRDYCLTISPGERIDLEEIIGRLVGMGYDRVDMVEGRGQFSVRGGILDLFPLGGEAPWRIELFDDEVDSIRQFDVASQRSVEQVKQAHIAPAREFLLPLGGARQATKHIRHELERAVERLRKMEAKGPKDETPGTPGFIPGSGGRRTMVGDRAELRTDRPELFAGRLELFADRYSPADRLRERVEAHLEQMEQEQVFDGLELYASFFYPEMETLFDYFPEPPLVLVDEPSRLKEASSEVEMQERERQVALLERGALLPSQANLLLTYQELFGRFKRESVVYLSLLLRTVPGSEPRNIVSISAKPMQEFHNQWGMFIEEIDRWRAQRYRAAVFTATSDRREKLLGSLLDEGIEGRGKGPGQAPDPGQVQIVTGNLESGFQWPALRLSVVTDSEIFGRPKRPRRIPKPKEGARVPTYHDLKVGDYVVHVSHGIGKYMGIKSLEVGGVQKDYLYIKYDGADRLYVPTDQIDLIQKYVGAEGHEPKIHKLGGTEWSKVKNRVKESIREMAIELLRLNAVRDTIQGHAFAPDTVWQREFEEAFPYEETPDQLQAAEEIKRNMERPRPMDRLLCGDVGYGKTEVAIRAAFKAAVEGKQAAVLVPTTILAQQHFNTFLERFRGYPMRIEVLNRFRSPKEQARVVEAVGRGEVDILIGTHRLLSEDVRFKELGLLVIDEEQRFGVTHKERLKALRQTVDVLTLSATPIPRTMHMALVGLRDMSVITSPPEDRFPVQTFVAESNPELVRDAVLREIHRGGQVYFVHNRVQTIEKEAARLQALVPEARILVAHGQMKEERLEQVMLDFLDGEGDVLCCTTIIESGLDIPTVNTIIVENADYLGLAQLYQLRGRVGRSNRLAYAYFLYRRDKVLTEVAEKRLQAIREFTEFGSGFKIAMRDLEIRGAGNILGPEQHGFIISVGFDLYCQLLEEAVRELRGEKIPKEVLPTIELTVDAYIPDTYIGDTAQKIGAYKRIISIADVNQAGDVSEEFADRYGDPPRPVENLLAIARLKVLARAAGISTISQSKDRITLKFENPRKVPTDIVASLNRRYRGRIMAGSGRLPSLVVKAGGWQDRELIRALEDILPQFEALSAKAI